MPLKKVDEPGHKISPFLDLSEALDVSDANVISTETEFVGRTGDFVSASALTQLTAAAFEEHRKLWPGSLDAASHIELLLGALEVPDMMSGIYQMPGLAADRLTAPAAGLLFDSLSSLYSPATAVLLGACDWSPGSSTGAVTYGRTLVLAGALGETLLLTAPQHGLTAHLSFSIPPLLARKVRRVDEMLTTAFVVVVRHREDSYE